MGMVMAVAFELYGRLYYLDPGEHRPAVGDAVLYPTSRGTEVATCVWAPSYVGEDVGGLSLCAGLATEADLERNERNRVRRGRILMAGRKLVRENALPMKIVAADWDDHDEVATLYFGAPHRVDFRQLVRDLARTLECRIELRQLNARDEARVQGGIGPCGRDTCCSTFLKDFEPVTTRMAKDQDLPLNPLRISGACGRLMCCLKYEHPLYQDFKATAPEVGDRFETDDGLVTVVGHSVPRDAVYVRGADGQRKVCSKASACASRQAYESSRETLTVLPPEV